MNKLFKGTIVFLFCIAISINAIAANFELKFATQATEKDPWGQHILRMADAVETATSGTVKITPFLGSQLGAEVDVIKQVARGRIDMVGAALAGASTMVPELGLLGTPFLFENWEQNDCVLDNHLASLLNEMFEKKGLRLIGYTDTGSYSVFSKKPIITPADAKGFKLRINQSKFSVLMWQSVGANPVPLPTSEFHAALQTGMVDGGDLSPTFYMFLGFNKMAPHLTITQHTKQPGFILMSLKTWKRLSETQKQQFMDAQEPISELRKQVRGLEVMMTKKYEEAGGPVHHLNLKQKQMWLDAVVPNQKKIVKMIGGESAKVWKVIQDAKASCGK
jgi:TRAP-type C4-dicarboxylate transport system substrate-binding protein